VFRGAPVAGRARGGRGAGARPGGGMNWHRGLGKKHIRRVLDFFGWSVVFRGRSGPGPAIRGPGPVPRPGAPPGQLAASHATQGVSSQFPGVLVGPPPVRKCHQVSSKEHIQLGWVVRWVLNTPPPGHPAAGRCRRVVPVPPLLLCTRPARSRPSIGGRRPTPAPRQLPWSPPRGWRSRRSPHSNFSRFAHKTAVSNSRPIGCDYSQPAHASPNLISSPTKSLEVIE
jgi:hypothetical protein